MSFLDYSAIFPYGFPTSSATGASFASGGSGASSPSSPVAGAPPPSAMVGPALSGASQLDSVDLSDGEDAVAKPNCMQPTETDSGSLVRRAGARAAVGHLYHHHSADELRQLLAGRVQSELKKV